MNTATKVASLTSIHFPSIAAFHQTRNIYDRTITINETQHDQGNLSLIILASVVHVR